MSHIYPLKFIIFAWLQKYEFNFATLNGDTTNWFSCALKCVQ